MFEPPSKHKKPRNCGASTKSRRGDSNPRPHHYERPPRGFSSPTRRLKSDSNNDSGVQLIAGGSGPYGPNTAHETCRRRGRSALHASHTSARAAPRAFIGRHSDRGSQTGAGARGLAPPGAKTQVSIRYFSAMRFRSAPARRADLYLERPELERRLSEPLAAGRNVLLLGEPGSGKSTRAWVSVPPAV
jgi:hypothetical protein